MKATIALFVIVYFANFCSSLVLKEKDRSFYLTSDKPLKTKSFWLDDARRELANKLQERRIVHQAKNVILFIGDGLDLPTLTASRIYDGQTKGIIGERNQLSFERFPYVGLAKTYCADKQVPDSSCSATAYFTGVKSNFYTVGVSADVAQNDCKAANVQENQLRSLAGWALDGGKAAGIVTTTRVTHASPAGAYAYSPNREFESDFDVQRVAETLNITLTAKECPDVAKQLIENDISKRFRVVLGGGTRKLLPTDTLDARGASGDRLDGRNLIEEWVQARSGNTKFVTNRYELLNSDLNNTDNLLGLFSPEHLAYTIENDGTEPTLPEMTEAAIKVLNRTTEGFFLFVEGGRIDHAHHDNRAEKAMIETLQFADAVQKAYDMTNPLETLIVVSSDHGHTMSISGYPELNQKINGLSSTVSDIDGLPYSTLSYANGPSFFEYYHSIENGKKLRTDWNITFKQADKNFQYPAGVPVNYETHDGADVTVYANGPWAHLFTGVMEQSAIPTFIGYAACIGPGLHTCEPLKKDSWFSWFL